jgi:hypothetical protein
MGRQRQKHGYDLVIEENYTADLQGVPLTCWLLNDHEDEIVE